MLIADVTIYLFDYRLLLLQVAHARNCKINKTIFENFINNYCKNIYTELISIERFIEIQKTFDLFLEQSLFKSQRQP